MTFLSPAPLGKWPLLLPLLGAIVGLCCAQYGFFLMLSVAAAFAIAAALWLRKPPLLLAAILALYFGSTHGAALRNQSHLQQQLATSQELRLQGTLIESNQTGLIRRAFRTEGGGLIHLLHLPENFLTGQNLQISGTTVQTRTARNPAGFDPSEILSSRGYAGSINVERAQATGWAIGLPVLRGYAESIRERLASRITHGLEDPRQTNTLRAVVLGEKEGGASLFGNFRKTGTMHIFAVSGLHVGLVALIAAGLARLLRLPPRMVIWATIFAMFGYAFITGLRPPALRAALMGTIFLSRFLLQRQSSTINNLFAAAIVVLALDTYQLWQIGFQLSFFVVGIILLLEPLLWRPVKPFTQQDPYLPKPLWSKWQRFSTSSREKLARMFTVSGAAWVGSAPLSALYFGWFTPIAAFASVLMVTLAFAMLALAFLGIALGTVSAKASSFINTTNGQVARFSLWSADEMSQWPGAWTRFEEKKKWEGGLCVFDIRFGGAAIHLDAGGGVLIDAASEAGYWITVEPALKSAGASCDSLIATHSDSQHVGGLRAALFDYPIRQILLPPEERVHSLGTLREIAKTSQATLIDAGSGLHLPVSEVCQIEVLFAGNSDAGRADDRGLVLRIHYEGWRILLTSDAGYATERALLASGRDLAADLWICGRNEGDMTGHDAFVRAVNPRAIIASDSNYPPTEKVPRSWRAWLEKEGIIFFSQREHGAVFVQPSADALTLSGFVSKQSHTLKR